VNCQRETYYLKAEEYKHKRNEIFFRNTLMRVLFLFLDGVGLGKDDTCTNPFLSAMTPNLDLLLSGKKLLENSVPYQSPLCTLLGIDPLMGVSGLPQSATNQATLFTGINFAKRLGFHYGPKPNLEISSFFSRGDLSDVVNSGKDSDINFQGTSIFTNLISNGFKVGFLNAYPDSYFSGINSKRRNHGVIPLAASSAGITLLNQDDLFHGEALSADFTGQGWHDHLALPQTPILSPYLAGVKLASLSMNYDFSLFEYWESDIVGHKQDFPKAIQLIEKFDHVLGGLLQSWDFENGMILITSDHGNLEDLSTRRHTSNQVPALLIGKSTTYHDKFVRKLKSIGDITPFINEMFTGSIISNQYSL
jgi:2,3-bisphosphoglycerate-independent phosphoglycerate mutase